MPDNFHFQAGRTLMVGSYFRLF